MFAEIQFTNVNVEVVLVEYVIRGEMHSRGEVLNFLNDRRYPTFSLYDSELHPVSIERKVEVVRQELVTVQKQHVLLVSVLDRHIRDSMQLTVSERKAIFYCGAFAIHGLLHVPADAPDEDILDETRDFFGITEGSVYSLTPVSQDPIKNAPIMLINRQGVEAYSVLTA